ncbi:unnamed protein product, partial [Amoebophrya sp. A120]
KRQKKEAALFGYRPQRVLPLREKNPKLFLSAELPASFFKILSADDTELKDTNSG